MQAAKLVHTNKPRCVHRPSSSRVHTSCTSCAQAVEMLYAYCHIMRQFNGDALQPELVAEATEAVIHLSQALAACMPAPPRRPPAHTQPSEQPHPPLQPAPPPQPYLPSQPSTLVRPEAGPRRQPAASAAAGPPVGDAASQQCAAAPPREGVRAHRQGLDQDAGAVRSTGAAAATPPYDPPPSAAQVQRAWHWLLRFYKCYKCLNLEACGSVQGSCMLCLRMFVVGRGCLCACV